MAAWYLINYPALATMVQAAHGPDGNPLKEFDMPTLELPAREMMICLLVSENK